MKKTLSVLLSLLMVVSCMTCLFTMPASAVETPSTESEAVENLPDNLLVAVEGSEGRKYSFSKDLVWKDFYQLDVVVTADEAATATTFYPTLLNSAGTSMNYYSIVGVRYSAADPTNVETAYNLKGSCLGAAGTAANNVAGTYTYTYIVSPTNGAKGISFPEDVTIESANFFELKNTDWNDFFYQGNIAVRYMVKEGNNVFQRFYGYRAVGAAATTTGNGMVVSANLSGKLFNIEVKAGQTYAFDYDMRLASNATITTYAPGMDVYDTEAFDARADHIAIRDAMVAAGTCTADAEGKIFGVDEYKYVAGGLDNSQYLRAGLSWGNNTVSQYYCINDGQGHCLNGQVIYAGAVNGYCNASWTTSRDSYWGRRITKNTVATLKYVDANGATIANATDTGVGTSAVGRSKKGVQSYANQWISGTYTLNGQEGCTAAEGYAAVVKNNQEPAQYMLNADANGTFTKNGTLTRIVSTTDVANVAFSIGYIYAGAVYDFDNFKVSTVDNTLAAPAVKGKNPNGKLVNIPTPDNTTKVTFDTTVDLVADTFTATFEYNATREAYGNFVGWYCGDELVSTEKTAALPYSAYKADPTRVYAVVEYENYLGNAGGLEGYTNDKNMSPPTETVTIGTTTYKPYTSLPTGDYWGVYSWNAAHKLPAGQTYSEENPYITELGMYGNTGCQAYATSKYTSGSVTITPYKGERMLKTYANDRNVVKAIEGLTPGKSYKISFYANSAIENRQVYAAAVATTVLDVVNSNTLAATDAIAARGTKLLTTELFTNDVKCFNNWVRYELFFTATKETEYLLLRESSFNVCYDEFVCQEYKIDKTVWDFEDGSTEGIRSAADRIADNQAGVVSLENDGDNKYLKYSLSNGRSNSYIGFNFNYDSDYRYKISFDLKTIKYAPSNEVQYGKVLDNDNNTTDTYISQTIDMAIVKFGDGNFITANITGNDIANKTNTKITRYYEDGTTYPYVTKFTHADRNYFTSANNRVVKADDANNTHGYEYCKFTDNVATAGDLWDEWAHWEIEIDPTNVNYSGLATMGWNFTGYYSEYGFDNIKIERVANTEIEALSSKLNSTYAFNIRPEDKDKGYKQGLRFKSSIDLGALGLISDKNDTITGTFADGSKIVEYGTLAANYHWYDEAFEMTRQQAKDVAKDGWVIAGVAYNAESGKDVRYDKQNGVVIFTGVLIGIDVSHYDTAFAVRSYVVIEDKNGVRTTIYGKVINGDLAVNSGGGISMIRAATAVADKPNNDYDAEAAQKIIDEYNAANKQ